MVITCWGAKGGAGTTVVAAAMAVHAAATSEHGALLVDLDGDAPVVLGVAPSDGPGVRDWLDAGPGTPPDGLARLEEPLAGGLALLPCGSGAPGPASDGSVEALMQVLGSDRRTVVVDVGCLTGAAGARPRPASASRAAGGSFGAGRRACYLALRRASDAGIVPDDVLLAEPGRALRADDVAHALGTPVSCTVPFDPAVAAVDAGLLLARLPASLRRAVGHG
ncbi:MAG: hypothetical protein R2699_07770 [Acidimicrobiales bacterium]